MKVSQGRKQNAVISARLASLALVGLSAFLATSCGKKNPATQATGKDGAPVALAPAHPESGKTGDLVPHSMDPKAALQDPATHDPAMLGKKVSPEKSKSAKTDSHKDSKQATVGKDGKSASQADGSAVSADQAKNGADSAASASSSGFAPVLGPVVLGVTPGTVGAAPVPEVYKASRAPASKPSAKKSFFDFGSSAPSAGVGSTQGAGGSDSKGMSPSGELAEMESAKPADPEFGCFTMTYNHKNMPGHLTGDACSQHRNLITLKHMKVNMKSVCVRVDGVPVRYNVYQSKKKKDDSVQLMIGPVAGPKAKITARYCMAKSVCNEKCEVPRDEFLEAMGGSVDESQVAKWDAAEGKQENSDVTQQIDAEVQRELAGYTDLSIFNDWVSDTEAPACGS